MFSHMAITVSNVKGLVSTLSTARYGMVRRHGRAKRVLNITRLSQWFGRLPSLVFDECSGLFKRLGEISADASGGGYRPMASSIQPDKNACVSLPAFGWRSRSVDKEALQSLAAQVQLALRRSGSATTAIRRACQEARLNFVLRGNHC
jgi:hypothetical protein